MKINSVVLTIASRHGGDEVSVVNENSWFSKFRSIAVVIMATMAVFTLFEDLPIELRFKIINETSNETINHFIEIGPPYRDEAWRIKQARRCHRRDIANRELAYLRERFGVVNRYIVYIPEDVDINMVMKYTVVDMHSLTSDQLYQYAIGPKFNIDTLISVLDMGDVPMINRLLTERRLIFTRPQLSTLLNLGVDERLLLDHMTSDDIAWLARHLATKAYVRQTLGTDDPGDISWTTVPNIDLCRIGEYFDDHGMGHDSIPPFVGRMIR